MLLLTLFNFAAAVQGFLLAFFLLRRRGRSLQHRLLAFLVALMAIVVLWSVLLLTGQYRQWPHLLRVADPLTLLFGPLLYFHVHVATRGRMPRLAWTHFVPFVAYVIVILPTYALSGDEKLALLEQARAGTLNPVVATVLLVRTVHMMLYSVISLVLLQRFQRALRDQYSNVGDRDLHRSASFLACYIAVTAGTIAIIAVGVVRHVDIVITNGVYCLLLSACIYGLAYASWKKQMPEPVSGTPVAGPSTGEPAEPSASRSGRRVHRLSDDQLALFSERMVQTLELERAYLDSDLTLAQISQRMQVPAYQVSEVISRHYRSNFFDAVNRLRVEEVKRRLADPSASRYSILGIAMDSGFNSKSSFNQAFRKHTGTTPSQFRKQ